MAEEREVVARLKVQKEGDTAAFSETADQIEQMGDAADSAAPKMESFGESSMSSSEQVERVALATGKVMAAMAAAGAILQTAAKGAEILGESMGGLGEETDATVKSVGDLGKALSSLDVMGTAAALGQTLANVWVDLTDATQSQVTVNAELIAQGAPQREHLQAVIEIQKELVEAERARVEKLELTAEALARQAESERAAGEVSKSTVEAIKANVAAYGSIPAPLAAAAASLGILSTAEKRAADDAKAAAAQHKTAVQGIVSEITGIPAKVGPPLQELSKTLSDALSKINFAGLNSEQLERAKGILQQFIDTSRQAGQQIPKDIADQAASMGILVAAMEVAGTANKGLRGTEAELKEVVIGTSQTFNSQGQELSRLTTITNQAGAAAKTGGAQIKEGATTAGEGLEPVRNVTAEVQKLVDGMRGAGSGSKTAGAEIKEGATTAGQGAEALKETGKAGSEAGTGLAAAKTGASGLGEAAGSAATGIGTLKTDLGGLGTAATPAATALEGVKAAADTINATKLTAFIAELKAVEAQAKATRAAVDAIDGAGGGSPGASAPAEPSAPGAGSDSGGGGGGGF